MNTKNNAEQEEIGAKLLRNIRTLLILAIVSDYCIFVPSFSPSNCVLASIPHIHTSRRKP